MSITTSTNGRLCNQLIRNMCVSMIAEKHNLFVKYSNYNKCSLLGINLFIGKNTYSNTIDLTDDNFFILLEMQSSDKSSNQYISSNINPNNNYFQTKAITNYLYTYLQCENIKYNIMKVNPFSNLYNTKYKVSNNNCCIHIRLTDVEKHNPGIEYYMKALSLLSFDKIYIASDDINNHIITDIVSRYPKTEILNYCEIKTIQFCSTCKYIILSHGSFSAVIGYLAFYSNIYYPEYKEGHIWYGDMFSIPHWNMITY